MTSPPLTDEFLDNYANNGTYVEQCLAQQARMHRALVKAQNEALEDGRRLTREMDIALHGDGAAQQASLCDLVEPARQLRAELAKWKTEAGVQNVGLTMANKDCDTLEAELAKAKAEIERLRAVVAKAALVIGACSGNLFDALAPEGKEGG